MGAEHLPLGGALVLRPILVPAAFAFLALTFGGRIPVALGRRSFYGGVCGGGGAVDINLELKR